MRRQSMRRLLLDEDVITWIVSLDRKVRERKCGKLML